jgi:hypothetical protein
MKHILKTPRLLYYFGAFSELNVRIHFVVLVTLLNGIATVCSKLKHFKTLVFGKVEYREKNIITINKYRTNEIDEHIVIHKTFGEKYKKISFVEDVTGGRGKRVGKLH